MDQQKSLVFCINQIDKGSKVTKTVDLLLKLPCTHGLMELMNGKTSGDQVKADLHDVVDHETVNNFKLYYWGDVSNKSGEVCILFGQYCLMSIISCRPGVGCMNLCMYFTKY